MRRGLIPVLKRGQEMEGESGKERKRVGEREEEEEEVFITSGNWRGKHNSLSRGAGADQP